MALRGVLLDVDGTLLLSNDAHARAWVEAYGRFGYRVSFDTIRPKIGMGGDKLMPIVTPGLTPDKGIGQEIDALREQLFLDRYVGDLSPAPGARAFVEQLRQQGLQTTIATSARGKTLQALLDQARVADLITAKATSDDAEESKPAPDIVAAALKKSGLDAGEVIMVGDTSYDVESGKSIEVDVVAVRCGGSRDDELAGAIAIYDDPQEIVDRYAESPFAAG